MFFMKDIFRSRTNSLSKKWLSCLAILILLISMFPATALGAGSISITTTPSTVTEGDVESISGFTATFTLPSGIYWGASIDSVSPGTINSLLIPNLKNAFRASSDQDLWNQLLNNASNNASNITVSSDHTSISIAFPTYTNYNIQQDQTITFTPPASLLEDSSSPIASSTFTITATPKAILSGSLTEGATEADIVSGGKTLTIKLVNCQWDPYIATNATKRETLFKSLSADTGLPDYDQWNTSVYNALVSAPDPSAVISRADDHTVIITLPPTPSYNISVPQTVTLNSTQIGSLIGSPSSFSILNPSFTINNNATSIQWSPSTPPTFSESLIRSGGATLEMKLNGNTWASDLTSLNSPKQTALLNGFTATDQTAWNNIKTAIVSSPTNCFSCPDPYTLKITLPAVSDYNIAADQTVTVQVPSTVLTDNIPLSNQLSFTITANPALAVTGTLAQGCNEMDIVNGGKTIVATLTNTTWQPNVTINETMREKLIDYLLGNTTAAPSDTTNWNNAIPIIKASATYSLDNPNQVTITLPPVPGFNITGALDIKSRSVSDGNYTPSTLISPTTNYEETPFDISISPVNNQTATVSGTITTASESDIVTGGKTMVITLNNDIWAPDIVSNSAKLNSLIAGLTTTTDNLVWQNDVVPALNSSNVVRTSDKVLTITLPSIANYTISQDQTINVTIHNSPNKLTVLTNSDINAGSITIKAVTVTLSGTAVTTPLDSKAVATGGRTIILTLNNATWASDVTTEAKVDKLLTYFSSVGTSTNWTNVIEPVIKSQNVTRSNGVLTIKLPPISTTLANGSETVTFKINGGDNPPPFPMLINETLSSTKALTDAVNKLQIGQTSSSISVNMNSTITSVSDVASGGKSIAITLSGGASWDPSLPTNSSKIRLLVKGFTSDLDPTSWALVQTALSSNSAMSDFVITSALTNNDTLTITLPPVSNFDPIKNQKISLTIPKTAIYQGTADVPVSAQISISLPTTTDRGALGSCMLDGSFVNYINQNSLNQIYLDVPTKYITSIANKQTSISNTPSAGGQSSVTDTINSLDIYTDSSVKSVKVLINSTTPYTSSLPIVDSSGQKYNISFATGSLPTSTSSSTSSTKTGSNTSLAAFDVTITALDSSGNVLQTCYQKISGSKAYSLAPKTDISGYYSLYKLMHDSSLLTNILKYYSTGDLRVRTK
ncbi:hypothetical protein [Desulfosporosinus sp. FKA]|uniref:hypothetical protein n=1 Tax=Desulfosporosinus sp. FKA TaxID=1969834 RepID=UPI000B49DA80|nr:hypothetical protein [Desulfosporosinus sp. FKA]